MKTWIITTQVVDLEAAPITPTLDRSRILDFTVSFSDDAVGCLIPAPEEFKNWAAVFEPFHYEVRLLYDNYHLMFAL